jgi:glycerophosphoryl diester phosphodiesterase
MKRSEELTLRLGAKPWIVGHRGAADSALENTLPSIGAALEQGARMVEVDVQITSDLVPVVFHDWDLRRLAGRGDILERTSLDRLLAIELHDPARAWRGRIPTLASVLAAVPTDVALNLEIKSRLHAVDDVLGALESAFGRLGPILASSFDWSLLSEVRRRHEDLPIAPLARYRSDELLEVAQRLGAFSVHVHRDLAPEVLEKEGILRPPVLAYTVNDGEDARHLASLGAAGVFTDCPGSIRADFEADV